MNKTQLYLQLPESNTEVLRFSDTYLAPSYLGLFLGLEMPIDVTGLLNVGDQIFIDQDDKTINTWIDGSATIIGITSSSLYPAPASLVFTDRPLQTPIVFSSGEAGTFYLGSQIQSNWTEVDLSDNVAFPITFNIADVRDINNRNGAYSKTIQIPGTKTNNDIFKYIFDIQGVDNYDTRLRVKCSLVIDTIPVLEGYIQLNSITAKDNRHWTYECVIFGENANFSKEIDQNARLEDLDFSEFDHYLNVTSITQSWSGDYTDGYYYPLIDYNNGKDPLYIGNIFTNRVSTWNPTNYKPSIYVKQYWDKIFKLYGYSYESEFLNSDAFNNLIIPSNKKQLENDAQWRFDSSFKAGITTPVISTYSYGINFVLTQPNIQTQVQTAPILSLFTMSTASPFFYNPQNTFNDSIPGSFYYKNSYQGTILKNQKIVLNLDYKITRTFLNPLTATGIEGLGFLMYYYMYKNGTIIERGKVLSIGMNDQTMNSLNTQPLYATPESNFVEDEFGLDGVDINFFNRRQSTIIYDTSIHGMLNDNDEVKIEIGIGIWESADPTPGAGANFLNTGYDVEFFETTNGIDGCYFYNSIDPFLSATQPIRLNDAIPSNIKQIDFINDIIKMFNLYLLQDKYDSKKIYIEPRDQFYTTEYLDWSNKLDIDKDIEQSPIVDRKKRVLMSYKEDKDLYNSTYKSTFNEIYGQYEYLTGNEIDTSDQKISLNFSPTPLSMRKISNELYDNRIIYTQILDSKQIIDDSNRNKVESNIRILYRKKVSLNNGIKHTMYYGGTLYQFDYYPYAGHLDDPTNPGLDLSFDAPKALYYLNSGTYTNNNLFNEYYDQFFEEIYGVESKTITAYVYLTAQDILDFDYRKLIYIDNISSGSPGYFRVNRIEYDPFNKQSYKIELIKVLNNFKSKYKKVISIGDVGVALPDWGTGLVTPGNNNNGDSNIISGFDNSVRDNTSIVVGVNNEVKNNGFGSIITGKYNSTLAPYSGIISSCSSKTYGTARYSNIIGGSSQSISGRYSNIIGGTNNIIDYNSINNQILGGFNNTISFNPTGTSSVSVANNSLILGGRDNVIEVGTTQSSTDNSFIIGGYGNTIQAGLTNSLILNGQNFTATQSNTIYLEGNVLINGSAAATVTPIPTGEIAFGNGTGITSNPDFSISATCNLNLGSTNTITGTIVTNTSFLSTSGSCISSTNAGRSALIATYDSRLVGTSTFQSIIAGGVRNYISDNNSSIIGGTRNTITLNRSVITGGCCNTINNSDSIIGGGQKNTSQGFASSIIGGFCNCVTNQNASIIGGSYNFVSSAQGIILGGNFNTLSGQDSAIIGGNSLTLSDSDTVLVPTIRVNNLLKLDNTSGVINITANTTTTISNSNVTSNSIIFLTAQSQIGLSDIMYVDNIIVGTSFDITFEATLTANADIGWMIIN